MRKLPDGRYEIENTQTGEKRVVTSQELPEYGLTPEESKLHPLLEGAVRMGGNITGGMIGQRLGTPVGAAVGSVAGPVGTVAGAVGGGYTGAVGGGGVGSMGAEALLNFIGDLMNDREVDIRDSDYGQRFKEGAQGQAIGIPAAKGLGFLAHPIKPFTNMVTKKLASSVEKLNFDELLAKWTPQMKDKFTANMVGKEGAGVVDDLATSVRSGVSARLPHSSEKVLNELDMTNSNAIKSLLQQNVGKYYSNEAPKSQKLEVEATKDLAHLLKEVIEEKVPGVKVPNTIASGLHSADLVSVLKHAPYNLPGSALMRLVGYASEPLRKGVQKAIPADGGYLNQLFPGLFSQPRD